jgi:protein pelota
MPEAAPALSLHHTGQAGMAGIHELMKRGVAGKLLDDTRVAHETRLVEELFTEISKDGMFAYGEESVANAVSAGAVRTLLVLDTKVRVQSVEEMLRAVEAARGEFAIVSSMHEAGRRLESLGGVAALLRYKVE